MEAFRFLCKFSKNWLSFVSCCVLQIKSTFFPSVIAFPPLKILQDTFQSCIKKLFCFTSSFQLIQLKIVCPPTMHDTYTNAFGYKVVRIGRTFIFFTWKPGLCPNKFFFHSVIKHPKIIRFSPDGSKFFLKQKWRFLVF